MKKAATIVFLDRFAVGVAGVFDPTRFVPADFGVDDVGAIVDPKKKCVRIVHIGRNTFPRDATTRVFNDAPALSDGSGREHAPTVNSRLTHLNERHGEEARCASVNGYLLSIIESKELAKVSSSYGKAGSMDEGAWSMETLKGRSKSLEHAATESRRVGGNAARVAGASVGTRVTN